MALLNRQHSTGGRSSRASKASVQSRNPASQRAPSTNDMFSNAASGVLSMLKTSTDVGDLGDFSVNTGRLPATLRPTHQRRNHPAHHSGSSTHTTQTRHSQVSRKNSNAQNYQGWYTISAVSSGTGRHGSMVSLPTTYDGGGPPHRGPPRSSPYGPPTPYGQDGRSYSLTQPYPPPSLKPAKSATSLRGQGIGPLPPQRPPYAYPQRPQRPGYRAPSPASSEFSGSSYQMAYGPPQGFGDDPRYPNSRLPGHHAPPHGLPHGHPQRPPQGPPPGQPYGPSPGPRIGRPMHRPPMPSYNSDFPHVGPPMPRYPDNLPPISRQPTPGNLNAHGPGPGPGPFAYRGPLAHQGPPFGIPGYEPTYRVGTPQMDCMPSSSEPGSSVPPSSNPPTPRDATASQVILDPAVVDPAINEIPYDQSDYESVQNYINYAEKPAVYELDAVEPAAAELEASGPTVRGGFVQRIKNLLEDRAAGQDNLTSSSVEQKRIPDVPRKVPTPHHFEVREDLAELPASKRSSLHEPYELEVPARITRTLIKANTAPSSSEQNTTTSLVPDDTVKAREERKTKSVHAPPQLEEEEAMSTCSSPHPEPSLLGSSDGATTSTGSSRANDMDFAVQIRVPDPSASFSIREHNQEPEMFDQTKDPTVNESGSVSPLRPEDRVVRDSIVSPMPTQTITAIKEQSKLPGSFPEDMQPHESPQVRPLSRKAIENSGMTSGFSLQPDPSQMYDFSAATEPAVDPVTDVAVKFSVPRTSDLGKAQLVNLSTLIETPVKSHAGVKNKASSDGNTFHDSFSSIEKVAPLHIRKLESLSPIRTGIGGGDLSSFIRRSFPRKKSMWSVEQTDSLGVSGDFTTDTGISDLTSPPGRLSNLKEDSKEDMSLSNIMSSTSGLRLSVTHNLHLKPGQENLRHSEDLSRSTYLAPRAPRMSLSEIRNLPSLNFSRMDLIDKLNEALDTRTTRTSRSMEVVKRAGIFGIHSPSPLRPASTEVLRERYTSFFNKPDEFEVTDSSEEEISQGTFSPDPLTGEDSDTDDTRVSELRKGVERNVDVVLDYQIDGSSIQSVRPMSSERFLSVATEANRLSIPSVAALSERLSELLPSIKHLNLDSVIGDDKAINDTIDEIHHLGHYGQRPESEGTGLVRSSTGLRQMAAVADNIVTNGTHDSTFLEFKNGRLLKELPPLPEDTEKFSLSDSGLDRNTTLGTDALSSIAEPDFPKPVLLRGKSLSVIDDKDEELHSVFTPKRSLVLSSQSLRPWNLDENYPWCGNSPTIDIEFPSQVLRRNSSASEVIRKSSRHSSSTEGDAGQTGGTGESAETTEPRSTLPSSSMVSSGDVVTPATLASHGRKASKRSIIGSLSRRMGLSTRSRSKSVAARESIAHRPGDRYPYTALQPPNNVNMDEVRSFFSDSTSECRGSERRGSFRKHITSFRARLPSTNPTSPYPYSMDVERGARSLDHHGQVTRANASGSLFEDRLTEPISTQNYDGMVGMGRMEFRVKRVAERLRHIWAKSGEMIRSISQRNRPATRRQHKEREVVRDDWLADSLYSGV